jgi:RNA polymerase sigma-70 factor (ECF subfamily)
MDEAPRALRAVDMGVSVDMGVRLLRPGLRSSRAGDRRPTVCAMNIERPLRDALLGAVPSLRAFAISLTNDPIRADDLVQDTLLRALSRMDQFERGTNLNAWLFTILRNLFHTEYRKRRREVEDPDNAHAARLAVRPEQGSRLEFEDFRAALAKLTPDQREALLLVGAQGMSYEETAAVCGVAVGTIKSRVNRARARLAELLALNDVEEIGPDSLTRAVVRPP